MKEPDKNGFSGKGEGNEKQEPEGNGERAMVIRVKGLENQVFDYEHSLELIGTGVAIANYNDQGKIVISYLNGAAKELFKHDLKEEISPKGLPLEQWQEIFCLFEKDGRPMDKQDIPLMVAMQTGKPTPPKEVIRKDGDVRYLRIKATPLRINGKISAAMMEFEDITSEREHEAELEERDKIFRGILNHVRKTVILIFQKDPLKIVLMTTSAGDVLGENVESLHKDPMVWTKSIHPVDRKMFEEKEGNGTETKAIREYRIVHENGAIRWVQDESFAVSESSQTRETIYRIFTDITEIKEASLKANERLESAEKELELTRHRALMASVTLQIVHDLKSSLHGPNSALIIMLRDPQSERNMKRIGVIQRGISMMNDLLESFSSLTRNHDPLAVEMVNSLEVIENMMLILDSMARKSISYQINPQSTYIRVTSLGLERILLNLILNAMQATDGKSPITLSTDEKCVTREELLETKKQYPWIKAKAGNYFRVVVTDQGGGMPIDVASKLYNEKITTKETGTGEGSLSIRTALAFSGGFPRVINMPEKGVRIEIYLPITEKPAEQLEWDWEQREG